jgi:signal transduction histidine kinase
MTVPKDHALALERIDSAWRIAWVMGAGMLALLFATRVLGEKAQLVAILSVVVASTLFFSAASAHRVLGAKHWLARALRVTDEIAWRLFCYVIIYVADMPWLWGLGLLTGVSFSPRTDAAYRRLAGTLFVGLVALASALISQGRSLDAVLAMVVLGCVQFELRATQSLFSHGVRVRAERNALLRELEATAFDRDRDLLARDLHDGIGADLTALVIGVDVATRGRPEGERRALTARTRRTLDSLRELVRSLRGGAKDDT